MPFKDTLCENLGNYTQLRPLELSYCKSIQNLLRIPTYMYMYIPVNPETKATYAM